MEVWPRGGAKSTSTELGVVRSCVRLCRRYVLYVSETQDQADKHVGAIAKYMLTAGVERAVNVYGHAKGWRRQELRTANGFNVSALGLDTASRGVKLDQFRPDLIIFDDVDDQHDTERIVQRKIDSITTSIIPAGSSDGAYLFVQNMVHEEGIVARLCDGRADFLHNREPAYVEPAVRDLTYRSEDRGDGLKRYVVTGGVPTWAGQDLQKVQEQLNEWGERAFLREAQHEVKGASGWFFDVNQIQYCEPHEVPPGLRYCRAWDLAATEGGGDWTCGPLVGVLGTYPDVRVWVTEYEREQWASNKVRDLLKSTAARDGRGVRIRLPQDPGQAGKAQAEQLRTDLKGYLLTILPVSGDKATRAEGFAGAVNRGNVTFVRGEWNRPVREVLRKFRPDVSEQLDDDVDALADGFNEAAQTREIWAV